MTPGQTFYLVLFGLYLTTCLVTGSKGAIVIRKKFFKKGWSLGHPFAFLGGLDKSLLINHLLPIRSYSIISNVGDKQKLKIFPPRHTKCIISIIDNEASKLRFFTFVVFYFYFLIIPFTYYHHGDKPITYITILIALLTSVFVTLYFFLLHRKLASKEQDVRWKNVFYALFMPWHVMRLADLLFDVPLLRKIHPLSYAAISSGEPTTNYLSQEYRNTLYLTPSLYNQEEFEILFKHTEFTPNDFTKPPKTEDPSEVNYCPCCHSLFTSQVSHCDECQNIALKKL